MEHGWIMTFHSVGNFIIPTDELIFFRGVGIPPTRVGLYLIGLSWRFACPKRTFLLSNVGKRWLCLCLGIPILGHVNGNNVWYLGVPNFEIHMSRESRAPTDWDILKWHWNRPANFGGCAWPYFGRTTHAQLQKKDKWVDGHRELYYWHIGTIITRHEFQESTQVPQTKKRRFPCRCIGSFTMLPPSKGCEERRITTGPSNSRSYMKRGPLESLKGLVGILVLLWPTPSLTDSCPNESITSGTWMWPTGCCRWGLLLMGWPTGWGPRIHVQMFSDFPHVWILMAQIVNVKVRMHRLDEKGQPA